MARDCISQIFSPAPSQGVFNSLLSDTSHSLPFILSFLYEVPPGAVARRPEAGRQDLAGPQASVSKGVATCNPCATWFPPSLAQQVS